MKDVRGKICKGKNVLQCYGIDFKYVAVKTRSGLLISYIPPPSLILSLKLSGLFGKSRQIFFKTHRTPFSLPHWLIESGKNHLMANLWSKWWNENTLANPSEIATYFLRLNLRTELLPLWQIPVLFWIQMTTEDKKNLVLYCNSEENKWRQEQLFQGQTSAGLLCLNWCE